MIEIKFRGKRVDNGEWMYGHYFLTRWPDLHPFLGNKEERDFFTECLKLNGRKWFDAIQDNIDPMTVKQVVPSTIGQYINKEDDHDNEIYKGDICKVTSCMDEVYIGEVVWNEELLCWALDYGEDLYDLHDIIHCEHSIEIIGNIYENPELLEVSP